MNQKTEITSKRFWLNSKDYIKGLFMAFGAAFLMALQTAVDSGEVHWKGVIMAGISGGLIYLIKNFFQPAQMKQNITSEQVDAMKDANESAAK